MTPELKQKILDKHNLYRQQQASGNTPNYGPATRMATLVSSATIILNYSKFS